MSVDDDKVVYFDGLTKLEIPPERVLRWAAEQDLRSVLVLGWTQDGTLYAAGSSGKVGDNLHLIEAFKHGLISGDYDNG